MPRFALHLSLLGIVAAALTGAAAGVGGFTFGYAGGLSYLSSDPKACANCHIMNDQYTSWTKSSHHAAATCVDCHLPHTFVPKYLAKMENGWHHSKAFTLGDFHEPIRIKEKNAKILQDNCLGCHQDLVHGIVAGSTNEGSVRCVHCHLRVGHGPVH